MTCCTSSRQACSIVHTAKALGRSRATKVATVIDTTPSEQLGPRSGASSSPATGMIRVGVSTLRRATARTSSSASTAPIAPPIAAQPSATKIVIRTSIKGMRTMAASLDTLLKSAVGLALFSIRSEWKHRSSEDGSGVSKAAEDKFPHVEQRVIIDHEGAAKQLP